MGIQFNLRKGALHYIWWHNYRRRRRRLLMLLLLLAAAASVIVVHWFWFAEAHIYIFVCLVRGQRGERIYIYMCVCEWEEAKVGQC